MGTARHILWPKVIILILTFSVYGCSSQNDGKAREVEAPASSEQSPPPMEEVEEQSPIIVQPSPYPKEKTTARAPASPERPPSPVEEVLVTGSRPIQLILDMPNFPWPPPQASATAVIPDNFFRGARSDDILLGDIDTRIKGALDSSEYFERSYYAVPDGFALVTHLENINPDGTPKPGDDRWAIKVGPLRSFSLESYLKALFTSNPGFFRIIVFIVTPHPFTQSDESVSRGKAVSWLHRGSHILPQEIATQPYTDRYSCTALIYEFEKIAGEDIASTVIPGKLPGRTHLERSQLWHGLEP